MKEKLIELLMAAENVASEAGFFNCHKSKAKAELIADYLIKNNVILLPCKIGTKLYDITETLEVNVYDPQMYEIKANDITVGYCDNENTVMYTIDGFDYKFEDFGKIVFSNLEEAEIVMIDRLKIMEQEAADNGNN